MPSEGRQSWHFDTPTSLAYYYRTKALPSDYGPAGLLEQGQRRSIRRSRRTVLRDYGPKEAASSRRRAVGTTGPFQGPRADGEQRTPPSTPPGPQYPSGTTGRDGSAGRLCWSTPQQADNMTTGPSGSGPTSQSDARDFGPKLLHADRPTGHGPTEKLPTDFFLACNASVVTVWGSTCGGV
jgi:hypothetical protein